MRKFGTWRAWYKIMKLKPNQPHKDIWNCSIKQNKLQDTIISDSDQHFT
jgi:hypothetical protein